MESLSISDNSMGDQFHDCNSQPASPLPKSTEPATIDGGDGQLNGSARPTAALSGGESSKENSPRPDSGEVSTKAAPSSLERKLKKKEDKNMDYVLKALSALTTPEEKLAALCKKYTDLLDDNRQHASTAKSNAKKLSQISRERDSLQTENSKLILAKSKLESLCRELQRHNKVVKEESLARQREEEERRKEVSSRFQTTISDIQTQMESHSKRNDKLQEDNKDLSGKLHTLLEQYEKREEHIQKLLQQKDLETQLLEAKLSQCQLMMEKEQEAGGAEKQMLLEKLIESKTSQETMAQTEVHLKTQLQIYTQKYAEFESTLNKSNEVFAAFKSEMEKMSKKIKKLEKESFTYKQRYENTNVALLEMVEQKTLHEKLIDTQTKKNKQLESLCRALQSRQAGEGANGTSPQPRAVTPEANSETQATNGHSSATDNSNQNQEAQSSETAHPPDNSVRPQLIGQSSDEQETASENEKADTSPEDSGSACDKSSEVLDEATSKLSELGISKLPNQGDDASRSPNEEVPVSQSSNDEVVTEVAEDTSTTA